jgi:hypothetical protein
MNKKTLNLFALAFLYFLIAALFILFSRIFLLGWVLLPRSLQQTGFKIVKNIFSLSFFQNPPDFIKPFLFFIFLELPILIIAYGIIYIFLRNKFDRKIHLKAIIFSFFGLFIFGLPGLISPKEIVGHKMPGFLQIGEGLRNFKCQFVSDDIFNWTYPENKQVNVSVHSAVVINFKQGVNSPNGCNVYYENGGYAGSQHKMLGGVAGQNIPIVPEGSSGIPELEYLRQTSQEQIKTFVSNGSWKEKSTIKVVCFYTKKGCSGQKEFTFTTGETSDSLEPTVKRQIPVIQLLSI